MEECRLIKRATLKDIADAIRETVGLEGTVPVNDYAPNIRSLEKVAEYDCMVTVDDGARPSITDDYKDGYNDGLAAGDEAAIEQGKEAAYAEISELNNALKVTLYGTDEGETTLAENVEQVHADFQAINDKLLIKCGYFPDEGPVLPADMPEWVDDVYNRAYEEGSDASYDAGYEDGYIAGEGKGGYGEGWSDGYEQGWDNGADSAWEIGYQEGKSEGIEQGQRDERTAFWNVFQNNGGTVNYYLAFAYGKFTDENYNPERPIRCSGGSTPGMQMFYNSPGITDTKVEIYANNNNLQGAFNQCGLVTIRKIHVYESTKYTNTFDGTTSLVHVLFEGTIGQSISFADCNKLSKESLTSVMTHLSTTATLTATFSKSAVNKAFETSAGSNDGSTSAEWKALKAALPNATISLI